MQSIVQQTTACLNPALIKQQFPVLSQSCRGHPLIYLDTGATAQKPQMVIDAVNNFYTHDYANIHRGVYLLSERATAAFEAVRDQVQHFINAEQREEIIFTHGATESINLIAASFGALKVKSGDEIILSMMEHHSNIVPWQMLCERVGAKLKIIPILENGTLDLAMLPKMITNKTRLIAMIHVSNVLGTINPIAEIIQIAHQVNVPVLIDGAQAVSRIAVDVQDLDCDFYVFSSHKMYGPTGVGVLYAKRHWLEQMPPYQGGGDMISQVSFMHTDYNILPYKFEAGTPNIAGVIGLGAAIQFIQSLGVDAIFAHERELTQTMTHALQQLPHLKIYGEAKDKIGVIAFTLNNIHPHDIGTILDNEGIAIRAGHHCAMPLMDFYQVPAMARVSLGVYNQQTDVDALLQGLHKTLALFGDV